jgi:hypothetical protein
VRYILFTQNASSKSHLPSRALFAGVIVYNLNGLVEVFLFLKTRPELLLFGENDDEGGHGPMDPGMELGTRVGQENGRTPGNVRVFDDEEGPAMSTPN